MIESIRAETLVLRKRTATWVLLAWPPLTGLLFGYLLPYARYTGGEVGPGGATELRDLLPAQVMLNVLNGAPFYVGMIALILGVVAVGSDFGWGTLKTAFVNQPDRLRIFAAKLVVLGMATAVMVVSLVAVSAGASLTIAALEDAAVGWPSLSLIARSLGAAWLILSMWALFGVMLAVVTRGTALAIGLGIVYGLVIEGLLAGFGRDLPVLEDVTYALLRTNGYSLAATLGAVAQEGGEPGFFAGPFVGAWQALAVIVGYALAFVGISAALVRRRDVA